MPDRCRCLPVILAALALLAVLAPSLCAAQKAEEPSALQLQVRQTLAQAGEATNRESQQELYEQAVEQALALLRAAPSSGPAWLLLGEGYLGLRRLDEAIVALRKAAFFEPLDPAPDLLLGQAHLAAFDASRAAEALSEGLRKHPEESIQQRFHLLLGVAFQMQGRYTDAMSSLRRGQSLERAEALQRYRAFDPPEVILARDPVACRDKLRLTEEVVRLSEDLEGSQEGERLEGELRALRGRCGEAEPSG